MQAVDPKATTTPSFDIRLATPEDSLIVAAQRVAMFRDMGRTPRRSSSRFWNPVPVIW